MNFAALHENLRLEILRRIERGLLSGSRLARATGFQQAHISNFLNCKRSLSLEGLDRVLAAQNLSVLDLLPAHAFKSKSEFTGLLNLVRTVPVATHRAASTCPRIDPSEILEIISVPESALESSREFPANNRNLWERFIAVRVDASQAAAMDPILRHNCIAVIDRHYNSLALYRSQHSSIYAVNAFDYLQFSFLEQEGKRLILRPRNRKLPVRILDLLPHQRPSECIVGRVCYVLAEI